MELTIGELLKRIRVLNNLTQQQFAKKFAITKTTLCNYENNARNPSFDFINAVCKEFDYELDYFKLKSIEESKSEDLIVKRKNNKLAIYDKRQKLYLTPFIYDRIHLSPDKYHIVTKEHSFKDKNSYDIYEIIYYSAVVDNNGNIKEFDDYIFGLSFNHFIKDICVVCKKNHSNNINDQQFLFDINKGIISKGYRLLTNYYMENYLENFYIGRIIEKVKFGEQIDYEIKQVDLLYKDGTIIESNLNKTDIFGYSGYSLRDSAKDCIKLLNKFGPEIITFFDINKFSLNDLNEIVISTVLYAEKNNLVDKNYEYCLGEMIRDLKDLRPKLKAPYDKGDFKLQIPELKIKNRIQKNYFIKMIEETIESFIK